MGRLRIGAAVGIVFVSPASATFTNAARATISPAHGAATRARSQVRLRRGRKNKFPSAADSARKGNGSNLKGFNITVHRVRSAMYATAPFRFTEVQKPFGSLTRTSG